MVFSIGRFLLLVLVIAGVIHADPAFIQPSPPDGGTHYTIGSRIQISWKGTDSYSILSLGIAQSVNQTISWMLSNSIDHPTSASWTVTAYGYNLSVANSFLFLITNGTNFQGMFYSPWVIIDQPTSSVSAAPTTSALPSIITVTATPTTFANSNQGSDGNSLSAGAKAGIGVGVAVAALAIAAAASAWYLSRKRSAQTNDDVPYPPPATPMTDPYYSTHTSVVGPAELDPGKRT